jgi:hypothetical protein
LLLCVLLCAGCGTTKPAAGNAPAPEAASTGSAKGGPTLITEGGAPSGGTPSGVQLGPQPCPNAVSSPSYWDPIIPTQPGINKVESVICAYLTGSSNVQALVTVRSQSAGSLLDVYIYDNITSPTPAQLFKLQGLYMGEAKISGYNTLLTGQVDLNSSLNKGAATPTVDLFREFKWLAAAATLVQVSFPGIFPDLTRYQAENDQQQVRQGQDAWKLNATGTATMLATNLLQWPGNVVATLESGGGQHDVNAQVSVHTQTQAPHSIQVTMSRLEGNTNGGIWIVTNVTSDNMSISKPQNRDNLTSPITVIGEGNAFEGVVGMVRMLDHLYTDIGHAQATGANGNGNTNYLATVSYTSTFQGGAQEGLVALYSYSNADGLIAGAIILKELLS